MSWWPSRSRTQDAPEQSTFLTEDHPMGFWRELMPYEDRRSEDTETLLNTIGREAKRPEHLQPKPKKTKRIEVKKNLDRWKKIEVRVGELPRTLRGALDRQKVRRQMRMKQEFIPQKLRLDAHRVH